MDEKRIPSRDSFSLNRILCLTEILLPLTLKSSASLMVSVITAAPITHKFHPGSGHRSTNPPGLSSSDTHSRTSSKLSQSQLLFFSTSSTPPPPSSH
ncbi:hypothetical protein OIU79_016007 [Salix purpurea]|uniref:Uncharacterized protein n=1 Tax=Salix purpurea TaxID=77065 RepID=A0A9Q0PDS9_SALPP|nr:hypothetical protein OIU79_016007 [Salix purpurea]